MAVRRKSASPRSDAARKDVAALRLAPLQPHEVRRLARRYGVTGKVVKKTIRKVGNLRKKVEAALKKM